MLNDSKFSAAKFSKYLTKYHVAKADSFRNLHTEEGLSYFVEILLQLGSSLTPTSKKTVLFCTDEDLAVAVYTKKEILCKYFYIPENKLFEIVDKLLFAINIEEIGLSTPRTISLEAVDSNITLGESKYICKGRIGSKYKILTNQKATPVDTSSLKSYIDSLHGHLNLREVILQERISEPHKVVSCCGFSVNGQIVREFQYVKLRQYPKTFGTGTYLKSIYQPTLSSLSKKIIAKFEYTGIFEIEFLVYDFEDTVMVLEMNPRTWKSINFASNCNQNLVLDYTMFLRSCIKPSPELTFCSNVYWTHLTADILSSISSRQILRYHSNTQFAVFSFSDFLPFIIELLTFPVLYWKRIKNLLSH